MTIKLFGSLIIKDKFKENEMKNSLLSRVVRNQRHQVATSLVQVVVFTLTRGSTLPKVFDSFHIDGKQIEISMLTFRRELIELIVENDLGILPDSDVARAFFLSHHQGGIMVTSFGRLGEHSFHMEEFPLADHPMIWSPDHGHHIVVPKFVPPAPPS